MFRLVSLVETTDDGLGDGGSKYLWNVSKFLQNRMAQHP